MLRDRIGLNVSNIGQTKAFLAIPWLQANTKRVFDQSSVTDYLAKLRLVINAYSAKNGLIREIPVRGSFASRKRAGEQSIAPES
jgi:hypothetical protein